MLGLPQDVYVTRSLEVYGEYCPREWQLLKQLIKPGMTVVEVGANIGTHTVPMAQACAPGRLYAFEPQQRVFQVLCANLALNNIGNAVVFPEGSGEAASFAVVPPLDYEAVGNFGGVSLKADTAGQPGLRVRITPLDSLELQRCDVLKIDVEGFEPLVLRGARETILRHRPAIYIENDRAQQQQEVISLIAGMGYRLYWHTPGLFDPDNFNKHPVDIFGRIVSLNMLCLPLERQTQVDGFEQIDPENWSSPVGRKSNG
jgi:FkbM family methyltransferase